MNKVQITAIAIKLQGALGHSAGDVNIKEVPHLLEVSPLEAVEALKGDLLEARKASEAAYRVYAAEPPHPVHPLCSETLRAYHKLLMIEEEIQKQISSSTRPWFEACGSPEWAGIYLPMLKYSTPKGSVNWDLTGPKPRVWIERSKPGQAGMGLTGEEVVTYDVLTEKLHWTERAEARHMIEMSRLIQEAAPKASKEAQELHAKWSSLEVKSAFRRAQLAIPVGDPNWSQKWDLLALGEASVERAMELGPQFYWDMVKYFGRPEAASVFMAALTTNDQTLVWEAAKLAA